MLIEKKWQKLQFLNTVYCSGYERRDEAPRERPRLQLQPRTKPKDDNEPNSTDSGKTNTPSQSEQGKHFLFPFFAGVTEAMIVYLASGVLWML